MSLLPPPFVMRISDATPADRAGYLCVHGTSQGETTYGQALLLLRANGTVAAVTRGELRLYKSSVTNTHRMGLLLTDPGVETSGATLLDARGAALLGDAQALCLASGLSPEGAVVSVGPFVEHRVLWQTNARRSATLADASSLTGLIAPLFFDGVPCGTVRSDGVQIVEVSVTPLGAALTVTSCVVNVPELAATVLWKPGLDEVVVMCPPSLVASAPVATGAELLPLLRHAEPIGGARMR